MANFSQNVRFLPKSIDSLKKTEYYKPLKAGIAKYLGSKEISNVESITLFERELEKYLLSKGRHLLFGLHLTIEPLIGYIIAKVVEVNNLKSIARFKAAKMSPEEIERMVVVYD